MVQERGLPLNYLSHLFTNVRNHQSRKVMEFSGVIPLSSMTRGEEYKCYKCLNEKRQWKKGRFFTLSGVIALMSRPEFMDEYTITPMLCS
jgi:hypothetical protein